MNEEQFQALMAALFDIKAEVRDLRNDLRHAKERDELAARAAASRRGFKRAGARRP